MGWFGSKSSGDSSSSAESWHQAGADRVYERIESGENFDVEAALMDAHLNIPSED